MIEAVSIARSRMWTKKNLPERKNGGNMEMRRAEQQEAIRTIAR
jgi:hypothetical protein